MGYYSEIILPSFKVNMYIILILNFNFCVFIFAECWVLTPWRNESWRAKLWIWEISTLKVSDVLARSESILNNYSTRKNENIDFSQANFAKVTHHDRVAFIIVKMFALACKIFYWRIFFPTLTTMRRNIKQKERVGQRMRARKR